MIHKTEFHVRLKNVINYSAFFIRTSFFFGFKINYDVLTHIIITRARGAFGAPAREKFIQSLGLLNQLNRITARRHLQK